MAAADTMGLYIKPGRSVDEEQTTSMIISHENFLYCLNTFQMVSDAEVTSSGTQMDCKVSTELNLLQDFGAQVGIKTRDFSCNTEIQTRTFGTQTEAIIENEDRPSRANLHNLATVASSPSENRLLVRRATESKDAPNGSNIIEPSTTGVGHLTEKMQEFRSPSNTIDAYETVPLTSSKISILNSPESTHKKDIKNGMKPMNGSGCSKTTKEKPSKFNEVKMSNNKRCIPSPKNCKSKSPTNSSAKLRKIISPPEHETTYPNLPKSSCAKRKKLTSSRKEESSKKSSVDTFSTKRLPRQYSNNFANKPESRRREKTKVSTNSPSKSLSKKSGSSRPDNRYQRKKHVSKEEGELSDDDYLNISAPKVKPRRAPLLPLPPTPAQYPCKRQFEEPLPLKRRHYDDNYYNNIMQDRHSHSRISLFPEPGEYYLPRERVVSPPRRQRPRKITNALLNKLTNGQGLNHDTKDFKIKKSAKERLGWNLAIKNEEWSQTNDEWHKGFDDELNLYHLNSHGEETDSSISPTYSDVELFINHYQPMPSNLHRNPFIDSLF